MMCPNSAFSNAFSSAAFNTVVHTASVAAAPPSTPRNSRRLMRPTQPLRVRLYHSGRGCGGDVPMSALGQKRTSPAYLAMSALPPKADKQQTFRYVRFVPKADSCSAANLFDHFVGAQQQRFWDREAEHLCSREIDDEIELGRLLHRDVGRFCPAQNLVDIVGGALKLCRVVCSIGHQPSCFDVLLSAVHRR